jgi:hypothetical protein
LLFGHQQNLLDRLDPRLRLIERPRSPSLIMTARTGALKNGEDLFTPSHLFCDLKYSRSDLEADETFIALLGLSD